MSHECTRKRKWRVYICIYYICPSICPSIRVLRKVNRSHIDLKLHVKLELEAAWSVSLVVPVTVVATGETTCLLDMRGPAVDFRSSTLTCAGQ